MSKNLFIQVVMVAISVGIIITFVKPTFSEIGDLQDDIVVYQTEQKKVSGVNARLQSLVDVLNSVPADDKKRLLAYMPDHVDTISVIRDLSLIANEAGVVYVAAESTGENVAGDNQVEVTETQLIQPKKYTFSLRIEGTYNQVKNLFALLEQNNYPIEVQSLAVQKKDGGFLETDINLSVYAHQDRVPNEEIVF